MLNAIHLAHATSIPFENLDILLGRPIRLDLDSLQAKLVRGGRGGYCFEQNRLLAAGLEALGFAVTPLAARVRFRATQALPRTHMLLKVEAEGRPFLADAGFGGGGPLLPIPFEDGAEARQFAWAYRLVAESPRLWALQIRRGDSWVDLYGFTLDPQEPVDYEMASYFVSTHPASIFTRGVIAQRSTPEARYHLRDRMFMIDRGGVDPESRPVEDDELPRLLDEVFGLRFAPGTRFPAPGA